MHEGVFEPGCKHQQLMEHHRKVIAPAPAYLMEQPMAKRGISLAQNYKPTIGQRLYTLTREALHNLLVLCQSLLKQGKSLVDF